MEPDKLGCNLPVLDLLAPEREEAPGGSLDGPMCATGIVSRRLHATHIDDLAMGTGKFGVLVPLLTLVFLGRAPQTMRAREPVQHFYRTRSKHRKCVLAG